MGLDASLQRIAAWIQREEDELQYEPDCGSVPLDGATLDDVWRGPLCWSTDDPLGLPMLNPSEALGVVMRETPPARIHCRACGGMWEPGMTFRTTNAESLLWCPHILVVRHDGYFAVAERPSRPMLDASEE